MIGHASTQLTHDTYGHLMPDAFDGFGEKLDVLAADGAAASIRGHGGATTAAERVATRSEAKDNPA